MMSDMEDARKAVDEFLESGGKDDTTVEEVVATPVTHETVIDQEEEEVTEVINKDVHQDHYHTTIQPIEEHTRLPETHTHHMLKVEERATDDGADAETLRRLEEEAAKFHNERVVGEATHTQTSAPVVVSEHIHHHIHELIQPVIQREVIQPSVIHTTVPIHEVHHNAAQHHSTTSLPAMTMEEFKKRGGVLSGGEHHFDFVKEGSAAHRTAFKDDASPEE